MAILVDGVSRNLQLPGNILLCHHIQTAQNICINKNNNSSLLGRLNSLSHVTKQQLTCVLSRSWCGRVASSHLLQVCVCVCVEEREREHNLLTVLCTVYFCIWQKLKARLQWCFLWCIKRIIFVVVFSKIICLHVANIFQLLVNLTT